MTERREIQRQIGELETRKRRIAAADLRQFFVKRDDAAWLARAVDWALKRRPADHAALLDSLEEFSETSAVEGEPS